MEWPFNECRAPLGPPDRGLRVNVGQLVPKPNPAFLLERYSSLDKLLGVTGWIKRFVNNCRKPQAERNFTPVLSPAERNAALCSLVRVVQAEHFEEEGGVVAKRLLAYPSTINSTSIAITLAAPLEAPTINFDNSINDYYMLMSEEWKQLAKDPAKSNSRVLLSFGNGPRDILVASGLTASKDSYINALVTAIPGVWVSPDHVGIVWCKQLVMAINKYLFDIVDPLTEQISENRQLLTAKARQYFQANRSMTLSADIKRPVVLMQADAFWYEDNRRIYQIYRPEIDKTTYLMIRLVSFPQNRFVAVESVNVTDKDWLFGCNAMYTYNTYRYCKQATSLTELSRWSGAAFEFGKRKLATINLHSIMDQYPDWTHVLVRVSPTRKPIILNVDINDYASRQITVDLPSILSLTTTTIKQETERNSIYYELILPGFNSVHQAYLLYMEPTSSCKASQYHVSAELHVPWAKNNEYYHFFTQLKRSPMKLRLYKSNPNVTQGMDPSEHVKVTLLLDPQCTFTISISSTWYHRLAQLARNYTPVLISYIAAVLLLAARTNILSLKENGKCMTIHGALMSEGVKPYYVLVAARLGLMVITSVPLFTYIFENASWANTELILFSRSLLVVPAYMTALGILHVTAAAILAVMVFSSQLAHRLFFRIVWRGGTSMAEKLALGLHKMPYIVIVVLVAGVPLSCGAASLVAGAAFYSFILSKMYEEYLEDYVYKLMAKVGARMCRMFKKQRSSDSASETSLVPKEDSSETTDLLAIEDKDNETKDIVKVVNKDIRKDDVKPSTSDAAIVAKDEKKEAGTSSKTIVSKDVTKKALTSSSKDVSKDENKKVGPSTGNEVAVSKDETKNSGPSSNTDSIDSKVENKKAGPKCNERRDSGGLDDDLNNLNFHMMMFLLWVCVTLVNVPALLTWARNFKYSMVLKPDTSYHVGLMMSACSACLWQMDSPKKNLKHYDVVAAMLFLTAVFIIVLGPFSLTIVNYSVTCMYIVITVQQLLDKAETSDDSENSAQNDNNTETSEQTSETNKSENISSDSNKPDESGDAKAENDSSESNKPTASNISEPNEDCECNEGRIYAMFKNLRDKFDFSGNES
ncbi:PGAP1-like protein domain-containing protein [Phthorimaea operculella]|nr:PGAP1-like protein domain-containing protein [Phthorimaea operculella]